MEQNSSQNVEILIKMKSSASEVGMNELRAVGNACFFKYNGDSRFTNPVLYEGKAHFSSGKCKRGQNLKKLTSYPVVITTFKQEPIDLYAVEDDIIAYLKNKKKYAGFPDELNQPLLR